MRNLCVGFTVVFLLVGFVNVAATQVSLGEPFDLAVGESKVVGDEGLQIGFTGILGDSRCPAGVVCIWEGDAAAQIFAESVSLPRTLFDLHTNRDFQHEVIVEGHKVSLINVAPYPEIDIVIDPNDYVITLVVTDASIPADDTTWGRIKALFE